MLAERFVRFIDRYRVPLLGGWVLHAFALHYVFIGFMTWDGLTYRVAPIVELSQHGGFGLDKFRYWGFSGYVPFLELIHLPFLYLFNLPGLIVGFPLVLFPLCVAAVYRLVRELTGEPRSATLAAIAYAAIPIMNAQPYGGYVDFAICGAFAHLVHAVLRMKSSAHPRWAFAALVVATALFGMSRTQAVYIAAIVVPAIVYALTCERLGWRIRIVRPRLLFTTLAAVALGAIPSLLVQLWKYVEYGTPTYPLQFRFLGLAIGDGFALTDYYWGAGLRDDSAAEMTRALVEGWLWHWQWPIGGFFDGRAMGGGLVLPIALLVAPLFVRRATRVEVALVVGCLLASLLARDVVVPRWAYAFTIALVVVIGRSLGDLAAMRRGQLPFWLLTTVLMAHLSRPEIDLLQLGHHAYHAPLTYVAPRLNVTGSSRFLPGADAMEPFPDLDGRFVIVDATHHSFILHIYGAKLSNHIIGTIPFYELGDRCSGLTDVLRAEPKALFIDDLNFTRGCRRECVISLSWGYCRAYRITPGAGAGP